MDDSCGMGDHYDIYDYYGIGDHYGICDHYDIYELEKPTAKQTDSKQRGRPAGNASCTEFDSCTWVPVCRRCCIRGLEGPH
jgi:hypothetical protein